MRALQTKRGDEFYNFIIRSNFNQLPVTSKHTCTSSFMSFIYDVHLALLCILFFVQLYLNVLHLECPNFLCFSSSSIFHYNVCPSKRILLLSQWNERYFGLNTDWIWSSFYAVYILLFSFEIQKQKQFVDVGIFA